MGVVVVILFTVSLLLGDAALSPQQVGAALAGHGDQITAFVVWELRMPRAVAAVVVGVCLGVSGSVFQSVLHNPLASPDVIGVTSAAGAAGVAGVLILHLDGLGLSALAIAGGTAAIAGVAVLAWRNGLGGMRLVLVGIGVAAFATAVTSYLLTRGDVREVAVAYTWLVGSLNGVGWPIIAITVNIAVIAVSVLAVMRRGLRALELGDSTSTALGFRTERVRLIVLFAAVILAAAAVGLAGPIGFIALMAPQIARRALGRNSISLVASAAIGAGIMSAADLIAQYSIPSVSFPAGVITGAIGAPYLAWLLARSRQIISKGAS